MKIYIPNQIEISSINNLPKNYKYFWGEKEVNLSPTIKGFTEDKKALFFKFHNPILGSDSEKLIAEAELLTCLNHKNIIKLQKFDFISVLGIEYPILYFKKHDCNLFDFINGNELKEDVIFKLIRQLIDVLNYLHYNSIVHNDLKFDNILIDKNGRFKIKLCDFGSALRLNRRKLKRNLGGINMFQPYDEFYSFEIDYFSLGVMLLMMFSKGHTDLLRITYQRKINWNSLLSQKYQLNFEEIIIELISHDTKTRGQAFRKLQSILN